VLDTRTPSVARAYDYLLGGEASFAADRALAGRLVALYPRLKENLFSSRTQLADAVADVAARGVDQYLDIGAGLPTSPATHEIARALLPAARVVYIDRDPVTVAHGTALVPAGVRYQDGDLTEPEALLAALSFLDFSRPVCLVLALVLQALEPGTARAVVAVLVKALPPGSQLVATVGTGDGGRLPDSVWPADATEADLAGFFGGLERLPPGITRHGDVLCGTGVKPGRADGGPAPADHAGRRPRG
jgi:SAM-dependent methyltransferase